MYAVLKTLFNMYNFPSWYIRTSNSELHLSKVQPSVVGKVFIKFNEYQYYHGKRVFLHFEVK